MSALQFRRAYLKRNKKPKIKFRYRKIAKTRPRKRVDQNTRFSLSPKTSFPFRYTAITFETSFDTRRSYISTYSLMETEKRTSFREEEEEEEEGFESFFHPAFSFFLRKIAVSRCITQRDTQLPFPPTFSRARNPEELESRKSPWMETGVYTRFSRSVSPVARERSSRQKPDKGVCHRVTLRSL